MIGAVLLAVCACGVAPERQNDFFWQNEKFGMRAYGPGEDHRWSGLDVFNLMPDAGSVGDLLHNAGQRGNWHKVPSQGILDNYTMGASRGVGGVAMFADGEWKTYPDWETCEIITNTPDRCEFKLVYPAFSLAGRMTYHITLEKGANFFRNEVSFERAFTGAIMGPGLDFSPARGHAGSLVVDEANGLVSLFEDSKGEVEGSTMSAIFLDPACADGVKVMTDHLGCRVLALTGRRSFTYYAGALWSKRGEITTAAAWHEWVKASRQQLVRDSAPK